MTMAEYVMVIAVSTIIGLKRSETRHFPLVDFLSVVILITSAI